MKSILLILTLLLIGCSSSTEDRTHSYSLPEGLSDCKIFRMTGDGRSLYVVRCPMSETSVRFNVGKHSRYTSTVEIDTTGFGEYNRLKEKFEK